MGNPESCRRWRPRPVHLVAGGLVITGFLLTSVSWWFLLLAGIGTFGPGILRELGWLRDKDEFQRQAAHRAGYHAFLVTGLLAFVAIAFFRSGERAVKDPEEIATLLLATLWFAWFFSSLLDYWGRQKTAVRTLVAFGAAWLVFAILSNVGAEWTGWTALLLSPLLTLPFFALAWMSGHWPRISGLLLLGACAFYIQLFGFFENSNFGLFTRGVTFVLFVGPLLASGLALLGVRRSDSETQDSTDDGGTPIASGNYAKERRPTCVGT